MTGPKSARSTTPAYASLRIMSGGPTAVKPRSERKSTAYLMIDCSSLRASPFRKKKREPETFAALSMSMRPRAPRRSWWSLGGKSNFLGSPHVLTVTLPLSSGPTGTDSWSMLGSDMSISLTRAWSSCALFSRLAISSGIPFTSLSLSVASFPDFFSAATSTVSLFCECLRSSTRFFAWRHSASAAAASSTSGSLSSQPRFLRSRRMTSGLSRNSFTSSIVFLSCSPALSYPTPRREIIVVGGAGSLWRTPEPSRLYLDPDIPEEPRVGYDARHRAQGGARPRRGHAKPDDGALSPRVEALVLREVPVVGHERLVESLGDRLVPAPYRHLDGQGGLRPAALGGGHPPATFSRTSLVKSSRFENGILAPAAMLCPPPTPPTLWAASLITSPRFTFPG